MVGQDRQAGVLRFTFGQLYLWNGLAIVPVMVGLFAIPEIVDLAVRGTAIAGNVTYGKLGKGVKEGIKDTFVISGSPSAVASSVPWSVYCPVWVEV